MTERVKSIDLGGWRFDFMLPAMELPPEARSRLLHEAMVLASGTAARPIRRSRHASTYRVEIGAAGAEMVVAYVKRYDRSRGFDRLKEIIRGSRLERTVAITGTLAAAGFEAPRIFVTGKSIRGRAELIVTAGCEGTALPNAVARCDRRPFCSKRRLLTALGEELGRLHGIGFVHGDLTPYNIFVVHGERFRFIFIDNDRTRSALVFGRKRRQLRNLVQLGRFEIPGLTRTDRLRFYNAYCSARGLKNRRFRMTKVLRMLKDRREKDTVGPSIAGRV